MHSVRTCRAGDLADRIEELAALRIAVFREWPYLYDGTLDYERRYLATYLENPRARVVVADADGCLIGMSTCLPLGDEVDEFKKPIVRAGHDPDRGFYFGESVLLPDHRGKGIGREFMEARLEAARDEGGMDYCCFCAVVRAEDDPRRPSDYRPLDPFWMKMGFAPMDGVEASFDWKEVGASDETPHRMRFWMRRL
ncbi:GNAT family acetyltransferase [Haloferula helveola]|uniref:GNAT family acetyltransferase n=1 Tax=Haloferula helveola TaxID=490095 RepID=A0ABM7RKL4_9BACT|nr:GNAT family acetyltransferase [Haloferula helveola]